MVSVRAELQRDVGQHQLLDRLEVAGQAARVPSRTGGLDDRRGVPLQGRVHERAPELAAAPPVASDAQGADRFLNEVVVRLGADLTADHVLDQVHDDLAQTVRRFLDGPLAGQGHLDLGAPDNAVVLRLAPGLGAGAHRLGGPVGLGQDLLRRPTGFLQLGVALVVRLRRRRPPPCRPLRARRGSSPASSPCIALTAGQAFLPMKKIRTMKTIELNDEVLHRAELPEPPWRRPAGH